MVPTVNLQKCELWQEFNRLQTEMIITKSGRRMFPAIRAQMYHLEPTAYYCILLEMAPIGKCRYKYTASGGWVPGGPEEAQSSNRIYLHPDSPATGEHWMSQPVSFGRLKLTNTAAAPVGHLVLSSMHKYQPRLIIVKTADPRNLTWSPSTCFAFPETQFIAVTAYQNERITKLKIDHNPFAKGFRENGHSKCKRKRVAEYREELEVEVVNLEITKRSLTSPKTDLSEVESSAGSLTPEPLVSENHLTNPCVQTNSSHATHSTYPYVRIPYVHPQNYDLYSLYLSHYMYNSMARNFVQSINNSDYINSHTNLNYPVPKFSHHKVRQAPNRFTDFSVNSIMNR